MPTDGSAALPFAADLKGVQAVRLIFPLSVQTFAKLVAG